MGEAGRWDPMVPVATPEARALVPPAIPGGTVLVMSRSLRALGFVGVFALAAVACTSRVAPSPAGPTAMEYLTAVVERQPLTIHFSLLNPTGAPAAIWVPRMLEPLGAFVTVTVRDGMGAVVCQTHRPKFTPKLKPSADDAYLELVPGQSHGALLTVDDCALAPGAYRVTVGYTNLDYRGTTARPIGALSYETTLALSL